MSKPIIGFIGLGLMGGNMVENLQKRGFEVIVMDLDKSGLTVLQPHYRHYGGTALYVSGQKMCTISKERRIPICVRVFFSRPMTQKKSRLLISCLVFPFIVVTSVAFSNYNADLISFAFPAIILVNIRDQFNELTLNCGFIMHISSQYDNSPLISIWLLTCICACMHTYTVCLILQLFYQQQLWKWEKERERERVKANKSTCQEQEER